MHDSMTNDLKENFTKRKYILAKKFKMKSKQHFEFLCIKETIKNCSWNNLSNYRNIEGDVNFAILSDAKNMNQMS